MSRSVRGRAWLAAVAVVVGAMAVPSGARADDEYAPGPRTVLVKDTGAGFKNETTRVLVNEKVTFVLEAEAQSKHSITFGNAPNASAPKHYELDPANPNARQVTITFDRPGYHTFRCVFHPHRGVVKVRTPVTAGAPTVEAASTGAAPVLTPAAPVAPAGPTPSSTAPKGAKPGASEPPTPSIALESLTKTIMAVDPAPSPAPEAPAPEEAAAPAVEAATSELAGGDPTGGSDSSGALVFIVGGVGLALFLVWGAWGWYHRSSRYQPA